MTIPGHQLVLKFGWCWPKWFYHKMRIYTHILHSNSKREKSFYPPIIWCCFCSSTFWHAWGFLIDLRVFIWFFQGKLPMEWSKENPPRLRWVMWKCIFQKSPGCRSRSKVGGPGLATTGTADFMWIFRDFFGTICYKLFNDFYGHMKQKLGNMSEKFRAIWLEHGTVSLTFWIWTLVPQMFFQSVETRICVLGMTLCFAVYFVTINPLRGLRGPVGRFGQVLISETSPRTDIYHLPGHVSKFHQTFWTVQPARYLEWWNFWNETVQKLRIMDG